METNAIATGYCHLSQDSPFLNVVRGPLRLENGTSAQLSDYDFYHEQEIRSLEEPVFVTWFGGWALTGMRRDQWLAHPFQVNAATGSQSDFEVFYRLRRPLVAHHDAYIKHIKPTVMGFLERDFLVGKVAPRTIFRRHNG